MKNKKQVNGVQHVDSAMPSSLQRALVTTAGGEQRDARRLQIFGKR